MKPGDLVGGRFLVQERVTATEHAVIWRAIDSHGSVPVAVKVFHTELNPHDLQIKDLNHPNVIRFIDLTNFEGQSCLVMEYADGGSVGGELSRSGGHGLEVEFVETVLHAVAKALVYLHRRGIIHRDVKPGNILLVGDQVKLGDLGIAKTTGGTHTKHSGPMTIGYAAPEMFNGRVSRKSDIYALGVTAYELLTGRLPFEGTDQQIMKGHLQENFSMPSGLTPRWEEFLRSCLQKKEGARWDAEQALAHLTGITVPGREPSPAGTPRRIIVPPGVTAPSRPPAPTPAPAAARKPPPAAAPKPPPAAAPKPPAGPAPHRDVPRSPRRSAAGSLWFNLSLLVLMIALIYGGVRYVRQHIGAAGQVASGQEPATGAAGSEVPSGSGTSAKSSGTDQGNSTKSGGVPGALPGSTTSAGSPVPAAPPAPKLTAPAAGAAGVSTTPVFTWASSKGATIYEVQVASDAGFGNIAFNWVGTSTSATVPNSSSLMEGSRYWWRVRAQNQGGSTWSNTATFSVATLVVSRLQLLSPADGSVGVPANPNLTWSPVAGATSYRLQVARDPLFISVVYDRSGLTGTSATVTGIDGDVDYWWRVMGSGSAGTITWSAAWKLHTSPTALPASQHPYPTQTDQTWIVSSPGASEMRLHFSQIELASGASLTLSGQNGTQFAHFDSYSGSKKDYWTDWFTGDSIQIELSSYSNQTAFGFVVDRKETRTGIGPASGNLAESFHPYANWSTYSWKVQAPGASQIRLHFSRLELADYDSVSITGASGWEIARYGSQNNGSDFWTEWYGGDTLKITLSTDSGRTAYGFVIDAKETRSTPTPSSSVVAESYHPYASDFESTWPITVPGAAEIRLHFSRLDLAPYDQLELLNQSGWEMKSYDSSYSNRGDIWTDWYAGNTITLKLSADGSKTGFGFIVDSVDSRTMAPPTTYQAETNHPYANNSDYTWTFTRAGAQQIRLHFSQLELASGDEVEVLDKNGWTLKSYYGSNSGSIADTQDIWTDWFSGDTVKVRLRTDSSKTAFGFILDQVESR